MKQSVDDTLIHQLRKLLKRVPSDSRDKAELVLKEYSQLAFSKARPPQQQKQSQEKIEVLEQKLTAARQIIQDLITAADKLNTNQGSDWDPREAREARHHLANRINKAAEFLKK